MRIGGETNSKICHQKILHTPCIFEHVYFARPDSVIDGISVHQARLRMGKALANSIQRILPNHGIDAVIPVPDSGRIAALGLATITWIGEILSDRNMAVGVASTGLALFVWLWLQRDLPLGFSFFWSTFTVLLLIALRVIEANPLMTIPILVLAFIFFADSISSQNKLWPKFFNNFAAPLVVFVFSILPIILASASALVATTLINY